MVGSKAKFYTSAILVTRGVLHGINARIHQSILWNCKCTLQYLRDLIRPGFTRRRATIPMAEIVTGRVFFQKVQKSPVSRMRSVLSDILRLRTTIQSFLVIDLLP